MHDYTGVKIRFLRDDERLISSNEKEMPLVIEAHEAMDSHFLQTFLASHSEKLLHDIARYGAVLLRGFTIDSDETFEKTILSIEGLHGISEVFMSENGRNLVDGLQYVLHTNAIYKTGGTLYLGGFHTENYYTPDVPGYICFFCRQPSVRGGETGLVHMENIYQQLNDSLKYRLEEKPFFVAKWLVREAAIQHQLSEEQVEKICSHAGLPIVEEGQEKFILMYKPSVIEHSETKKRSLQINLFELPTLNREMRKQFRKDYHGKHWFWHRLVWQLPSFIFHALEYIYKIIANLFYSPTHTYNLLLKKLKTWMAQIKKPHRFTFNQKRVGDCFTDSEVKHLAVLIRNHYSSCLWQKGDILLVDNTRVAHAGMPGAGARVIRAMIANPLSISYSPAGSGCFAYKNRANGSIGFHMALCKKPNDAQSNDAVEAKKII